MYLERALTLNCSKELNEISKKKKWLPEYVITKIYSWKKMELNGGWTTYFHLYLSGIDINLLISNIKYYKINLQNFPQTA